MVPPSMHCLFDIITVRPAVKFQQQNSALWILKGRAGRHSISNQLRQLILDIKTKNPSFGCPQIAAIIYDRTGITLSDETVRRTLMKFYRGTPGNGPSWLSFISSQADSLWSVDLFCAESILLKTHWIMIVMDQWARQEA